MGEPLLDRERTAAVASEGALIMGRRMLQTVSLAPPPPHSIVWADSHLLSATHPLLSAARGGNVEVKGSSGKRSAVTVA